MMTLSSQFWYQCYCEFWSFETPFSQTDLLVCLAKWVMMLSEFDLKFVSQKIIKGKSLIDHLAEAPSTSTNPITFIDELVIPIDIGDTWELYFNGSWCKIGFGFDVILVSPSNNPISLSYYLNFSFTNNITKYEALIAELKVTLSLRLSI